MSCQAVRRSRWVLPWVHAYRRLRAEWAARAEAVPQYPENTLIGALERLDAARADFALEAMPRTAGEMVAFLATLGFWVLAVYVVGTTLGLLPA